MIYCPNCKKPSAKTAGPCPHCGEDLLGRQIMPAVETEQTIEQASLQAPQSSREDLSMGETSTSGIELDEDAYVALRPGIRSSAPVAAMEINDAEIREVARFGTPRSGLIGSVKYKLKVKSRLKELKITIKEARARAVDAEARQKKLTATLGRVGYAKNFTTDAMEQLVSAALVVDGELQGAKRKRDAIEIEHNEKKKSKQQEIAALDEVAAPIREEEITAQSKFDGLKLDKKRAEAKLKRAEIELRNTTDLLEKRQKSYAAMVEESNDDRQKLLAEISEIDKRQPEIRERISLYTKKIATLAAPLEEAKSIHQEVLERLSKKTSRITALRKEMEDLNRVFEQAAIAAHKKIHGESAQSEDAWFKVGECLLVDGAQRDEEIDGIISQLLIANENVLETRLRVELVDLAMCSYDEAILKKGNKILIGAAILSLISVIIAISMMVI